MASILRTLTEQHDLSIPEAVHILRRTLDAEESEAGQTKAVNILLMGLSALGGIASLTNPIGLTAAGIAIVVNWACQSAHKKDYANIRDEQSLVHHAPMILDAMLQYHSANIATESTLIAAYEHCLRIFDEETETCVSDSQIEGTNQYQQVGFEPTHFFRQLVGSAIVHEDPVLKVAGKKTGLERMYDRMGVPMPQDPVNAAIGNNTRVNALPVASQDVPSQKSNGRSSIGASLINRSTQLQPKSIEPETLPVQNIEAKKPITALDRLLASPYTSRAFFGAQRTGKSYLAAIASQILVKDKSAKIFHINLLSYTDETGICEDDKYWNHATKSVRGDLPTIADVDEVVALIQDAIALVEEWFKSSNAILIVDEWAYVGSTANSYSELLKPLIKIIADKVAALKSGGIKRAQAIWTIAPEFVAGTMSQDAKVVKKLNLCYVTIPPNKSIDWNGSRVGFDAELFECIKFNYPIEYPNVSLNCDRICFVDNRWLPVGELPKLEKVAEKEVAKK